VVYGRVGHGRRRVVVRDLPLADRPVVLLWAKGLGRCPDVFEPNRRLMASVGSTGATAEDLVLPAVHSRGEARTPSYSSTPRSNDLAYSHSKRTRRRIVD
jgi:hypothetical protein